MGKQEKDVNIHNKSSNNGAQGVFYGPVEANTTVEGKVGFLGVNAAVFGIIASLIVILAFFGISSFSGLSKYFSEKPVNEANSLVNGVWLNRSGGYQVKMFDGVMYDDKGNRVANYVVLDSEHIKIASNVTTGTYSSVTCSMKLDQNNLTIHCDHGSDWELVRQ